jgi:hypothetical protein
VSDCDWSCRSSWCKIVLAVAATLFGLFPILVAGWWVYTAPLSSDPAGYTQAVVAAIFSVGVTWLLFKFVVPLALKSLASLLDVINTTN